MNKTAEEATQGDDNDTRGCDYIPMSGNDHNGDTKDDTDINGWCQELTGAVFKSDQVLYKNQI